MDKLYITCPHCGKKLLRIDKDSQFKNIYVWCKICKKEIKLNKEPLSQDK